jgi:pimeloyl-ACP methyl ester carboxylesterase
MDLRTSAGTFPGRRQNVLRTERQYRQCRLRPLGSLPSAIGLCLTLLTACAGLPPAAPPGPHFMEQEKIADLPGGHIVYLDSGGSGVPVLLLHPNNVRMWRFQFPSFARAGFRIIAIDYRNRSGTSEQPDVRGNVMRIDQLTTQLALPNFHLIGTGGGSVVAMQYALAHPDKIRALVITNSLAGLRDKDINALELSLRPPPFNQLPQDFRELSGSYRAAHPEGVQEWLQMEKQGRDAIAPPAAAASGAPTPSPNPNELTLARLDLWTAPTLMLTGDADLYTPPSVMRLFVSHLKHGTGAVIPDSGHDAYWENPEAFNRELLAFIRNH